MPKTLDEEFEEIRKSRDTGEDGSLLSSFQALLEEPYNETDPFVVFDPELPKPKGVESFQSTEMYKEAPVEKQKWDGIKYPILIINGRLIDSKFIDSFELRLTGIVPETEFVLSDNNKELDFIGGPGLANSVIVIMTPQYSGVHRKISLPFYISDRINVSKNEIKYKCKLQHYVFHEAVCEQIGAEQLTTYELCSEIAKRCGFGFACTIGCEDITDKKWRQVYSKNLCEYLEEQVLLGGNDEEGIFDAWIDAHGYLVLVNLAKIFDYDIQPGNLMIGCQTGSDIPTDVPAQDKNDPFEMLRIVTDLGGFPIKNLVVTNHYPYLNTKKVQNTGANGSFWYLTDVGGTNTIIQQDVQMVEDSMEGKVYPEFYSFPKVEYIGAVMNDDNYMIQQRIRDSWMVKRASRQIVVKLKEINFGLERGTFVNVMINETDSKKIAMIKQNQTNTLEPNPKPADESSNVDESVPKNSGKGVMDDKSTIINPAYTAMYYINGIEYDYDRESQKFTQFLFLIRKDNSNPLFSFAAGETMSDDQATEIAAMLEGVKAALNNSLDDGQNMVDGGTTADQTQNSDA